MNQFLSKFLYVTKGRYQALIYLIFVFLLMAMLELISLGMVGPFIAIATNQSIIHENYWTNLLFKQLNFGSDRQFLLGLGFAVILIFYIKSFVSFSAQKSVFDFGFKLQAELMAKLLHSYLAAPYTYHLNKNSSTIIKSIIHETSAFCTELTMPLLTCISNGIVITALLILLIKTDAMAMVIILGILIIAMTLFHFSKDKLSRWGKEFSESQTEMIQTISHSLGGLKETRVIGCENYFENQMQLATKKYKSSASNAIGFSNLPRYIIEAFLITFLIGFSILYVVVNQNRTENLTSILGTFAIASIRLLPAVGNLFSAINGIKYKSYALDNLYADLKELDNLDQEQIDRSLNRQLNSDRKSLSFNNEMRIEKVKYQYPQANRLALNEISLTLKKGESIGLIGKSGSGKTTLVDVILGLLQSESGDIKVDGESIYTNLRSWQNTIGYVPQSIFLIDDTLERNIAFGVQDGAIDRVRLNNAIQSAQLVDLVEQLPHGTQTTIGERGIMLSGGQRQRIGIARALYHEREILVFDEATAALDNETEALVTESMKALSGKKTMIIIAHRLSTLEHCDRIYQLENGKIIRVGSYEEVVLDPQAQT